MQKLQNYWVERSSEQKLVLVAAFAMTFLAITVFGLFASRTNMSLLYGGLDSAQAGEVVGVLENRGIAFEVRGGSVWVEATQRDLLRVELAAKGLPSAGGAGYELLDGMSGFGTTAQMFDAAYWRAKEGELARTILAVPGVKSARVHLAVETGRGYRQRGDSSGSVTLTTNGTELSSDQAAALRFLIASGVPGMRPENVKVFDTRHGLIGGPDDAAGSTRAAELKRNVERILEPHVGQGNAIVEVNLDLMTDFEQLTEQRVDPEQRAVISQLTEESTDRSNSGGAEPVTAASNLPDGENGSGERQSSDRSENRQQTNYELGTITREISRQPGAIRRLTVAVLVNGVPATDGNGAQQVIARGENELSVLQELVASAVGYDEARGDVVTVKSLPFAGFDEKGTLAQTDFLDRLDLHDLIRLSLLGLIITIIFLIGLRAMNRKSTAAAPAAFLDESQPPGSDLGAPMIAPMLETYENDASLTDPENLVQPISMFGSDGAMGSPSADSVDRLRQLMREHKSESVKLLNNWIDNKGRA